MADINDITNTQSQTSEGLKLFINAIEKALADTAIPLVEVPYGPKNYTEIFRHGFIESPIESIKMGGNQFIKFATVDRDFTMGATYETLTNPSLICEIKTEDKKTSTKKPIHIYAKSFVIQDTNNKKVIQSLIVMKTEGKFMSGAFPNDISEVLSKIKKTDEVIFANENIRRVATSLLRVTGSHEWEVTTSPTNPLYDITKVLSIKQLEKDGKITTGKLEITKDNFNEYYTYFEFSIKKDGVHIIPTSPVKPDVLNNINPSRDSIPQQENLSSENNPQKLMQNNVTYGFAYNGKIYLDPDLINPNTPVHEYTHLWDAYTQKTNPELWEKGRDIFSQTQIWKDVRNDKNYADIASDDNLVLSEVHARICGDMAQKILERIAIEDGEITKDKVIDWDKEVQEYIAKELSADFPVPEIGSETYEYDSAKQRFVQDFFAKPMKDLMSGIQIVRENDFEKNEIKTDNQAVNYELEKIQKAGIKVNLENGNIKETLAWLNEANIVLQMLDEKPISIQMAENEKSVLNTTEGGFERTLEKDMQDTPNAISTHIRINNSTIQIQNQAFFSERFKNLKNEIEQNDNMIAPKEFLNTLKEQFDLNLTEKRTGYAFYQNENDETFKIRISNHNAILKNRTGSKTDLTSVVVQLCENKGRNNKNAVLKEYVYHPAELTKEKELSIVEGINSWVNTGIYTGKYYDEEHISTAAELKSQLQRDTIQKHTESFKQNNNITNQKERKNMENEIQTQINEVPQPDPVFLNQLEWFEKYPKAGPIPVPGVEENNGNNLVPVCKIPTDYDNFQINSEGKFYLTTQHVYSMMLTEEQSGRESTSTLHFHGMGKEMMKEIPGLLCNPKIVAISEPQHKNDAQLPRIACVLDKTRNGTDPETGETVAETLVAFIEPPKNPRSPVSMIVSAYPLPEIDNFIERRRKAKEILYENSPEDKGKDKKKTLKRDQQGIRNAKPTTVFFKGSFYTLNITQFEESVNIKRMEQFGMYIKDIPEEQRTDKVCNAAFRQDKNTIVYFPEKLKTVDKYAEIIETKNMGLMSLIPDENFGAACEKYMKTTHDFKNRPDKLYEDLNSIITDSQRELLKQHIALKDGLEKEYAAALKDEDVKEKFIEWYKENPNLENSKTHKMVLDSKENLQQFDTDKSTVNTLVEHIQESGIPCHTDRDEFFRVKKLIEESKGEENSMTLRTSTPPESPQYQINEGVTFGYVYKGEIYFNPDLINTNTICHEYTHLWDEHIRITNPELCKKGIELYKKTALWNEAGKTIWEQVEGDEFYRNKWKDKSQEPDTNGISNYDQAVFSECHARAVGKFGAEILRRIREEDGVDIADAVIDWNKEASDYLAKEFGVEFTDNDLVRDFFAKPMQDLFSRKEILRELDAEKLEAQLQTEKENINQKERNTMENMEKNYLKPSEFIEFASQQYPGINWDSYQNTYLSQIHGLYNYSIAEDGKTLLAEDKKTGETHETTVRKLTEERINSLAEMNVTNGMLSVLEGQLAEADLNVTLLNGFENKAIADAALPPEIKGKLGGEYYKKAEKFFEHLQQEYPGIESPYNGGNHAFGEQRGSVFAFFYDMAEAMQQGNNCLAISDDGLYKVNLSTGEKTRTDFKEVLQELKESPARTGWLKDENLDFLSDRIEQIITHEETQEKIREGYYEKEKEPDISEQNIENKNPEQEVNQTMKNVEVPSKEQIEINEDISQSTEKTVEASAEPEMEAMPKTKNTVSQITKDPDGTEVLEEFDANGNLVHYKETDIEGNWKETETEYDKNGKVTHRKSIDSEGDSYEMTREYDENGVLRHEKNSAGNEWVRDENGNIIYSKLGDEERWSEYDERGNEIHIKYSDGYENFHEYDEQNRIVYTKNLDPDESFSEMWTTYKEDGSKETHTKNSNGFEEWREYDEKGVEVQPKEQTEINEDISQSTEETVEASAETEKEMESPVIVEEQSMEMPEQDIVFDSSGIEMETPEQDIVFDNEPIMADTADNIDIENNSDLAKAFNVSEQTIERWKEEQERQSETLAKIAEESGLQDAVNMQPSISDSASGFEKDVKATDSVMMLDSMMETEMAEQFNAKYEADSPEKNWDEFNRLASEKKDTLSMLIDASEPMLVGNASIAKDNGNLMLQFDQTDQRYNIESGKWHDGEGKEAMPTEQSLAALDDFKQANKDGVLNSHLRENITSGLQGMRDKGLKEIEESLGISSVQKIEEPKQDVGLSSEGPAYASGELKIPESNELMKFLSSAQLCGSIDDYEKLYNEYAPKFTIVEQKDGMLFIPGEKCPEEFSTPLHPASQHFYPDGRPCTENPVPYECMNFSEKMAYLRKEIWEKYHPDNVLCISDNPDELKTYKMLNNFVEKDEIPTPEHFKAMADERMTHSEDFNAKAVISGEMKQLEEGIKASFEQIKDVPGVLFSAAHLAQVDNFLDEPYRVGITVPVFEMPDKTGLLQKYEGFTVSKILDLDGNELNEQNGKTTSGKTVVLEKFDFDREEPQTVSIDIDEYKRMISENRFMRECIKNTDLNKEVIQSVKYEYQDNLGLNKDLHHENTAANFLHNFDAVCRTKAENLTEAKDIAKKMIAEMSSEEQKKFEEMTGGAIIHRMDTKEKLKAAGTMQLHAASPAAISEWDKKLTDIYMNAKKEVPMDNAIVPKNENLLKLKMDEGLSNEELEKIKMNTITREGENITDKADLKVGDTVKWDMTYKNAFNESEIKMKQKMVIASANERMDVVVLLSPDKSERLEVPYNQFVEKAKTINRPEIETPEKENVDGFTVEDYAMAAEPPQKIKTEPQQEIAEKGEGEAQKKVPSELDQMYIEGNNTAAMFEQNIERFAPMCANMEDMKILKEQLVSLLPESEKKGFEDMAKNYTKTHGMSINQRLDEIFEANATVDTLKKADSFTTSLDISKINVETINKRDAPPETQKGVQISSEKDSPKIGDKLPFAVTVTKSDGTKEKLDDLTISGITQDGQNVLLKSKNGNVSIEVKTDFVVENQREMSRGVDKTVDKQPVQQTAKKKDDEYMGMER